MVVSRSVSSEELPVNAKKQYHFTNRGMSLSSTTPNFFNFREYSRYSSFSSLISLEHYSKRSTSSYRSMIRAIRVTSVPGTNTRSYFPASFFIVLQLPTALKVAISSAVACSSSNSMQPKWEMNVLRDSFYGVSVSNALVSICEGGKPPLHFNSHSQSLERVWLSIVRWYQRKARNSICDLRLFNTMLGWIPLQVTIQASSHWNPISLSHSYGKLVFPVEDIP